MLVPLPRVHLVRYGGCLAPHSHLRGAIMPTPRQQGVATEATDTGSLCWRWARLLKRVLALDLARCPWCPEGTLWMMAAITQGEVIRTILRPLQLAVDPPAMAPACVRQEAFAWPWPDHTCASPTRLCPMPWRGTTLAPAARRAERVAHGGRPARPPPERTSRWGEGRLRGTSRGIRVRNGETLAGGLA